MTALLWIPITAYIGGITACAALALPFWWHMETGRKKLEIASRQRGQYTCLFAAVVLLLTCAILTTAPTDSPLLLWGRWLLAVPATSWAVTLWQFFKIQPTFGTPAGFDSDYDAIKAEFPLAEITSDAEYHQAVRFCQDQWRHDTLARRCGNEEERLTVPQWRFVHEVQDMFRAYARKFPRLLYGQEWYDERQAQIRELESLIEQATRLQAGKTTNTGAIKHLSDATNDLLFGLDWCKNVLEGKELPSGGLEEHILDSMDRHLEKRIVHAREAVRLFEAEQNGEIKYETPARTLIVQAGYERKDFQKAEALLKQAVVQAKNPDADTKPLDLVHALCSLAQVYHHHLGKLAEAEALYMEAYALQVSIEGRDHLNTAKTSGRLSSVLLEMGQLRRAVDCAKSQVEVVSLSLPGNLSDTVRAMEWYAHVLEKNGQVAEAEATLKESLALCDKHDYGLASGLYTIDALDELIEFLERHHRYEDAVELVDRVIRFQSVSTYGEFKSPETLRMYARILRALGHDEEVEAFQLEERAAEADARYARHQAEPVVSWNALEQDLEERLLDEI